MKDVRNCVCVEKEGRSHIYTLYFKLCFSIILCLAVLFVYANNLTTFWTIFCIVFILSEFAGSLIDLLGKCNRQEPLT